MGYKCAWHPSWTQYESSHSLCAFISFLAVAKRSLHKSQVPNGTLKSTETNLGNIISVVFFIMDNSMFVATSSQRNHCGVALTVLSGVSPDFHFHKSPQFALYCYCCPSAYCTKAKKSLSFLSFLISSKGFTSLV